MYKIEKLQNKKTVHHNINGENNAHNVESNMTFNLVEEHPSHKYMVMSKRKNVIPRVSNLNLIADITQPYLTNRIYMT